MSDPRPVSSDKHSILCLSRVSSILQHPARRRLLEKLQVPKPVEATTKPVKRDHKTGQKRPQNQLGDAKPVKRDQTKPSKAPRSAVGTRLEIKALAGAELEVD